ncbi:hypothetical protein AA0117_g1784 [Alternaria alternata]|jgi:hypothetical protein|uniref:Lysine-specific metallo-endopeptidase domain-containing protein n=1 Tax=Alternaria alternata TaxID=5599 RepID=A0A4Q4NW61_ALTAL|nr:hypothetical protein AALT_g6605 [Alternaria alternata]RYN47846.1 hypothetical protein AA0118_g12060 [Alternaria tenuissima]RYN84341.1 hypothetical protein AA0117_g1784 [Alternaria alternata]
MTFFFRAILFVTSLFPALIEGQALKPRTVWFDESCRNNPNVEVDKLWGIIQQMKADAQDNARVPVGKLYEHIFKDSNNAAFISATLNAISNDLVATKDEANTLIFCDEDARFKVATDEEAKCKNSQRTKKLIIDRVSDIVYDGHTLCSKTVGRATMGGTYCNNKLNDEKRCSITLCKDGIFFKSTQRRGGLYRFQEGNTDFSIDDGAAESGPLIDNWNLLDTVILHEITHTIHNEDAQPFPMWIDVGYEWNGVKDLYAAQAKQNADSMAYFGLGSWIQKSASQGPYRVLKSGSIKKGQ